MQSGKILVPSIAGTTAMTLFSYAVSESKNRNFREPEVLGQLIERLPNSWSRDHAQITGWFMHYVIGYLFMVFYHELWKRKRINASLTSGALFGAASGVVGIISWKVMFESHPNPQAKNLRRFFGHLLLAHIVFGIFCALAYKKDKTKISG